jgi:sarcosine oxidase
VPHFDVIVAGVGGMGSAAVYHLAKRGLRVLGLERFDVPNDMGSSHGSTRIIRLAYYEDPSYVPLLHRSYELWRQLETEAGEQLLHITGSIDASPAGTRVFEGSRESCLLHNLPHEVLTSAELTYRFPGYQLPEETMAVLQPEGGFLLPERCIVSHVALAQALGAEVHGRERVLEWSKDGRGVRVKTDRDEYTAHRLVVTAGPWAATLLQDLGALAIPERQVLGWFQPRVPAHFALGRFPVFNVSVPEGRYYGFPQFHVPGFKLGRYHHLEEHVPADQLDGVDRRCHPQDEAVLRDFVSRYIPDADGPTMALKVCLFTNSPDEHFIIDKHPGAENVTLAAGFSGHGFKFCSVVGEVLADLAIDGRTAHDVSLFRLSRFS